MSDMTTTLHDLYIGSVAALNGSPRKASSEFTVWLAGIEREAAAKALDALRARVVELNTPKSPNRMFGDTLAGVETMALSMAAEYREGKR